MSKPGFYTGYESARFLRISQTKLVELVRRGCIQGFSRNLTPLIIKDGHQIIDDSAKIGSEAMWYNEKLKEIKREKYGLEHTFIAPGPPAYEEFLTKFWEKQSCEWQFKIEDVLLLEKKLYPERESVLCSEGSTKGLLSPCEGATTDTNLESVVKERKQRIVAEGKALKKQNARWTIPRIAEEIANNNEIKLRLGCGDLAPVTIEGYLKGHGIGNRGRPKAPKK